MVTLAQRLQVVRAAYEWENEIIKLWKADIDHALPPPRGNPIAQCFAEIWQEYYDQVTSSNDCIIWTIDNNTPDDARDLIDNHEHNSRSMRWIKTTAGHYHDDSCYFDQLDRLLCLEVAARDLVERYLLWEDATCDLSCPDHPPGPMAKSRKRKGGKGKAPKGKGAKK